jgi:phosphoribosylaminoimidazole-succinocarboxamide synthase
MVVKKVERIPVECVVRGYLAGSGWAEYQQSGTVAGFELPRGLQESEELPEPLFTPTTKADTGHDLPITMDEVERLVGEKMAAAIQEKSLAIYHHAREYAGHRGIIIADTKMEFGLDDGQLILIDEVLTPDSSRISGRRSPATTSSPSATGWWPPAGIRSPPPRNCLRR